MFDLFYKKNDNSQLFSYLEKNGFSGIQNYIPIYSRFFNLDENNFNNINLNNRYSIKEIVKRDNPQIPVIIMTAHSDLESAVESYEHGAWEYLPKPFDIDQAVNVIKRSIEEDSINLNESDLKTAEIIGEAPAMQEVFRAIGKLSNSNSTVLLIGESGKGKELVSKALFQHSPRKDKPFLALNMADIPKELLESELFGHEKGSFTGANESRKGYFEVTDGGTIFLDEIGEMPLSTQSRLLRILENGEFIKVGSSKVQKTDVRIIAATNVKLKEAVEKGNLEKIYIID